MRLTSCEAVLLELILFSLPVSVVAHADEPVIVPVDAPGSPAQSTAAHRGHGAGAEAGSPGFETLADGSTRFSVGLSQIISYDAKEGSGRLTYIMKRVRVGRRNDYNPLVTVDFNTPVTSARLTPHGRDLWFVIDLRAPVKPEVTTDTAKNGGMVLNVEFPKGDYIVAAPDSPPADTATQELESKKPPPSVAPATGARGRSGRGRRRTDP